MNLCMKAHFKKYNLGNVFTIVKPDPDPKDFKTVNLYEHYGTVTANKVAASNEWHATMTENLHNNWFVQNLKLTKEWFSNNSEEDLTTKVYETHLTYPITQQGRPLIFKLVMDTLQNNTADAAMCLINVVKNLKITDYDGKDVTKVVSLMRSMVCCLSNLTDENGKSALPEDFADTLLDVFKTSSVDEFTQLFTHYANMTKIADFQSGTKSKCPSIETLLTFAETQCCHLYSTDQWSGVVTKVQETAFVSSGDAKSNTCFNCGGNHVLNDCPKPQNEARVKANKKIFYDNKKRSNNRSGHSGRGAGGGGGCKKSKWSPPTEDEKKNWSCRNIDGKPHYCHFKTKRCKLVDKPDIEGPPVTGANVAGTGGNGFPPPHGSDNNANPGNTGGLPAAKQVAIANTAKTMEECFRGLLSQIK